MGEIVEFPVRGKVGPLFAETLLTEEARQHIGAAYGLLHDEVPPVENLELVYDHLATVIQKIDMILGIRRACGE